MSRDRKFFDRFANHFNEIENELEKSFSSSEPLIEKIVRHSLLGEGKRLRPLLFILSSLLCDSQNKDIYHLSTIFEYIHCASLLHDDVIDNADTRRKKPSASNLWGNTAAVLTGDFLFSMAFNIAIESKNLGILSVVNRAAVKMTEGQVRELFFSRRWDITEEDYLEIITLKTAELLSVSCESGAVIADINKERTDALKNFGLNMGIAFQIVDDLLDYSASEEEFGKPVGKDFREGKVTLPLIYTIREMNGADSERFKTLLTNGSNKEEDYDELIDVVRKSGNMEKTKEIAQKYVEEAAKYLESFPASPNKDNLLFLNDYMVKRLY